MIRTANQYKEAKDFIDKELELYDYALSEKMTSYEYNLYLQDTQYCFNILYEKLRVLEDLIEYLDYYSKIKIDKVNIKGRSSISVLYRSLDLYISFSDSA